MLSVVASGLGGVGRDLGLVLCLSLGLVLFVRQLLGQLCVVLGVSVILEDLSFVQLEGCCC